jgi:hypothetical protein
VESMRKLEKEDAVLWCLGADLHHILRIMSVDVTMKKTFVRTDMQSTTRGTGSHDRAFG